MPMIRITHHCGAFTEAQKPQIAEASSSSALARALRPVTAAKLSPVWTVRASPSRRRSPR